MSAPCEWTVLRVYPDGFSGERVNIGVVVIADGKVYRRMTTHWDRVEAFTGSRTWLSDYAMACDWDAEGVRWQAENSNARVRFDALQPSMEADPESLLRRLEKRYLSGTPTGALS